LETNHHVIPYPHAVINSIVEAYVSLQRVRSFLLCKDHHPIGPGRLSDVGIVLENVSAVYSSSRPLPEGVISDPVATELVDKNWEISLLQAQLEEAESELQKLINGNQQNGSTRSPTDEAAPSPLCLRRITANCHSGEFIAVVGGVGSGKSSIVNTILGEVTTLSGTVSVQGKLAYFSQTPFIMNASVRDNILFGHVGELVDEGLYQRAIDVCALRRDLDVLPNGDETEIGEKGITLSGGQKARIALAR
jgi:ABC-type multidrug transport system fused ATPase/permease subunit